MTKNKSSKPKSSKGRTPARSAPLAKSSLSRSRVPVIRHDANSTIVKHMEFVTDVDSDAFNMFSYLVYNLSPGDAGTFPWLSQFAKAYESFTFESMTVHYKPSCAATQGGKVVYAIDFDAQDPTDNETKATLLQWEGATDCPAWEPMQQLVSRSNLNKVGPTRFIEADTGFDRLTSAGTLYVATTAVSGVMPNGFSGQFNIITLGELWIEYSVRLTTPAVAPSTGIDNPVIVEPQLAVQSNSGTVVQFEAAGSNLLRGLPVTATLGVEPTGQNTNAVGVQVMDMPLGSLMDPGGNLLPSTQRVLRFDRDFAGDLVYQTTMPSGYQSGTIGVPEIVALRQVQPAELPVNSGLGNLISNYVNIPDLLAGAATVVQTSGAGTVFSNILKLAVQKGTYLLLQSASNWAFGSNPANKGVLRLTSRKFADGDLFDGVSVMKLPSSIPPMTQPNGSLRSKVSTTPLFVHLSRRNRQLIQSRQNDDDGPAPTAPQGVARKTRVDFIKL